jgi:ParB family chromosome partitioning protein
MDVVSKLEKLSKLPEQRKLPIEWLERGQYQPRHYFDQIKLEELAKSIKQQGLIQPIVVRPIAEKRYEILAGERRWRAAQLAGLQEVPTLIRDDVDDESALEIAIIENIQRENLNPIEEADVYNRLNYEFGYTHEEIGQKIGKDRVTITNKLRLLKLDERVKKLLQDGYLMEGHGIQLTSLPMEHQYKIASLSVKNNWSIRRLQKAVRDLKSGVFDKPKSKKYEDPDVLRIQNKLSSYLGTKTEIRHKNTGAGQIIIDYPSVEVFEGLLDKLYIQERELNE